MEGSGFSVHLRLRVWDILGLWACSFGIVPAVLWGQGRCLESCANAELDPDYSNVNKAKSYLNPEEPTFLRTYIRRP